MPLPHLERPLAVDVDHDDVPTLGNEGTVDDCEVAVEEALPNHAVASDTDQEGRRPIRDQQALKVDFLLNEIVGRAGETGRDDLRQHGQRHEPAEGNTDCLHSPSPCPSLEQIGNTGAGSSSPYGLLISG